jgi:isoleucyl-tRNA synthetase
MTRYNPLELEKDIFQYWKKKGIYEKAKKKGESKKDFYFLDGPPYTSGKVHIGTAWNKAIKDATLRYKRMRGYNVWDRAGYDMHGLPTANKVASELGLKTKEDIKSYGLKKFIRKCKEFSLEKMEMMNKDFQKLGVWMDFKEPYKTASKEYISGEWWLVKRAYEKGLLYEGEKTMTWCPSCGTALAKHELEYKEVCDNSIFLKFKVKGTKNKYLILWTTTPWTIPFNLGVMAHPDFEYIEAEVEGEIWILARALAGGVIRMVAGKDFKELKVIKGKEFEGLEYEHPFSKEIPEYKKLKKKHPKVHSVVLSDAFVDLSAGSGLVHLAPGCGPEDYEVGRENNIPPFNEIDQYGVFPESMGRFAGWVAKKDDEKFVDVLKEKGALIAISPVEHDYAHCWRCHSPVIFRKTTQWFFNIEKIKEKLKRHNKKIKWVPEWAGKNWFDSWLDNLKDNSITRQRYWGAPLPIWRCEKCNKIKVIGSYKELLKESGKKEVEDLHIPEIDKVKLKCECGGDMKRLPDILDVWVDSGTASWNCLDFPDREDLFKKYFPADFILEGKDQIRGWFNLLLICSEIGFGKAPFKNVYMHGFVQDAQGRKMSKSLQNYITPDEVIDKYGADTFRYFVIACSNPGLDFNYNFDDLKVKMSNLRILWNLHKLLLMNAELADFNPYKSKLKELKADLGKEERFILSRLNSTIKRTTELMDNYELNKAVLEIEQLFLDLSREYIQYVRDKLNEEGQERELAIKVMFEVLYNVLKLFAPFAPFLCDRIFLNFKEEFGLEEESIHLVNWPDYNEDLINQKTEEHFKKMDEILQSGLYVREKAGYGVRWPLQKLIVETEDKDFKEALTELKDVVLSQLNIKELEIVESLKEHKITTSPNKNKIYASFGEEMAPAVIKEAEKLNPREIVKRLKRENNIKLDIKDEKSGEKVKLLREHFNIEHKVEEEYEFSEFSKGSVIISTKMNKELKAEGFSREVIRRVQAQRKKAGLEKSDKIELWIAGDKELLEILSLNRELIQERVGADSLELDKKISDLGNGETGHFKIKGKQVEIFFKKT